MSALDDGPAARCWNARAVGELCGKHADCPNWSLDVKGWVHERSRAGLPMDEGTFSAWVQAQYPRASFQQPQINDFQKFVACSADLSGAGRTRIRSRGPG